MNSMARNLLASLISLLQAAPGYSQWLPTSGPKFHGVSSFAASGPNLFAGTYAGIFLSSDDGATWKAATTGMTDTSVKALCVSGTNLFAGTDGGIFRSTNNGTSWTDMSNGLTNSHVWSFAESPASGGGGGTDLFAGTYGGGLFLSTNDGTRWSPIGSALDRTWVLHLIFRGTHLFADVHFGSPPFNNGVYLSTDNGTSWTYSNTGLPWNAIEAFAAIDTDLFAGTYGGGVFLSTNNGASWTAVNYGLSDLSITALVVCPASGGNGNAYLFAGTGSTGVYLSTNNGTSWKAVNAGLTDAYITALTVSGTFLFAGTFDSVVYRRPIFEMTGTTEVYPNLPTRCSLEQNYPNPFNPSTIISFNLPSQAFVSLKVFDLMGREVTTLVDENLIAGTHSRQWNADGLPSGVYFCRLSVAPVATRDLVPIEGRDGQAGLFTETRRLVLLR